MNTLLPSAVALVCLAGAASACPDPSRWGDYVQLSGADIWTPYSVPVVAGGDNRVEAAGGGLASVGGGCRVPVASGGGSGFFTTPPDFTFDLWGLQAYQVEIRVDSACDATLLANTAGGQWVFDDDGNGNLDPRIRLARPLDGYLDVWVGSYDGNYCDATLTLESFHR